MSTHDRPQLWLDCNGAEDRSAWDRQVARFYEHWKCIAPSGLLPGRQHFEPIQLVELLPRLWLLDVVRCADRRRYRYRLVGTLEVETLEREVTGLWFDEVHAAAPQVNLTLGRFDHMVQRRVATWRRGPVRLTHQKDHKVVENCMVPLARDGARVDMIMAFSVLSGHSDD